MRIPLRGIGTIAAVLAIASLMSAQAPAPEYRSADNVLQRTAPGGYRVAVSHDLIYIGGTRFYIRSAADAELHLYAKANGTGKIQRLLWVQIESQLPGQDWQYNYPSRERTKLGSLEFITDTKAYRSYVPDDPTSDFAQVQKLLLEHHLQLAGPAIRMRMIYLPDPERRRELMVIYAAPLSQNDAAKIPGDDGVDGSTFPALLEKLTSDAKKDVRVDAVR